METFAKVTITFAILLFATIVHADCTVPPASVTASAIYNGGTAPWSTTFANGHRSAALSSTTTGQPYYQWILCNADGSLISENPTVAEHHVNFSSASDTYQTSVLFDLPGTYYFRLRAGCSRSVYTSSSVVTVNVPYPEMGIAGNLLSGLYACEQMTTGAMTRRGLTWSINFNVYYPGDYPDWNKDFAIFQRYKRGDVSACGGTAGLEGWNTYDDWGSANKLGNFDESTLELVNLTRSLGTMKEAIEGLQNGDNVTLTVTMKGYDTYKVVLMKNCTPPTAVEASMAYNGGVSPWVGTFADEHRSAVYTTSATQYPYYQWYLCDASGNEISSAPTDAVNNVHFLGESSGPSATAQFNLPGRYYFRVKVGCDASHYTESAPVLLDVPYPEMMVAGPLFYSTWDGTCNRIPQEMLARNGLTWSKTFNVTSYAEYPDWKGHFAILQRYKRGDQSLCEGVSGTAGFSIYDDYNTANKLGYAAGQDTINCTKSYLGKNDGNFKCTGLDNCTKVTVEAEMTGYDSYRIELIYESILPLEPSVVWRKID